MMKDIDYKLYLNDFMKIYNKKPFDSNQGGMRFPHMFSTFCLLKNIQPKLIIESGVWKGYGTWLFEQVCPDAKFICIEPMLHGIQYKTKNILNYTSKDFNTIDWNKIIIDNKFNNLDVLVFLDDHQDFYKRLKYIVEQTSIKKIIVEDNYPKGEGGITSPKKILTDDDINEDIKNMFEKHTKTYFEFPPIYQTDKHRFGNWKELYPEDVPLFTEVKDEFKNFIDEMGNYTWMCYLELK
jgi:hypothetical protein